MAILIFKPAEASMLPILATDLLRLIPENDAALHALESYLIDCSAHSCSNIQAVESANARRSRAPRLAD